MLLIKLIVISTMMLVTFTACSSDENNEFKNVKGFYISFSDIRSIMSSDMHNKEEIKEMSDKVKPAYMYGYNFTFLYIDKNGKFYHYFSKKDKIRQETYGTIKLSDKTINFDGNTLITEKNKPDVTVPFVATMKCDTTNSLMLTELKQDDSHRIYGTTGYKQIESIDDMMFLTFSSITDFSKDIDKNKALKDFPEIVELFKKSNENIKKWKSLPIETAFYIPTDGDSNSFIFLDNDKDKFILFEKDKMIYNGKYLFKGKNMFVIDNYKNDFLPFMVDCNPEINKINGFKTIDGREFKYYPKLDYLTKLDEDAVKSISNYPFASLKFVNLLDEIRTN